MSYFAFEVLSKFLFRNENGELCIKEKDYNSLEFRVMFTLVDNDLLANIIKERF